MLTALPLKSCTHRVDFRIDVGCRECAAAEVSENGNHFEADCGHRQRTKYHKEHCEYEKFTRPKLKINKIFRKKMLVKLYSLMSQRMYYDGIAIQGDDRMR